MHFRLNNGYFAKLAYEHISLHWKELWGLNLVHTQSISGVMVVLSHTSVHMSVLTGFVNVKSSRYKLMFGGK